MRKRITGMLSVTILLLLICCFQFNGSIVYAACEEGIATVIAVKGFVEARRSGEETWFRVGPDEKLCHGDMIRVKDPGRVTVKLVNELNWSLYSGIATLSKPEEETPILFELLKGAAHIFSRMPRSLRLKTPFVDGDVEGTEFFVAVEEDRAIISVFEGRVAARNDKGSLVLSGGYSAMTKKGMAPEPLVVAKPRDAVQWALYYPELSDYRPEDVQGESAAPLQDEIVKSLKYYQEGSLAEALECIREAPEDIRDPKFFVYRATLLLQMGSVAEALADIEKAIGIDPKCGHAYGLKSIILVVQNEKAKAMESAKQGVAADASSSAAWIALSYAQQANFDLNGALESVQQAVTVSPENAMAYSRLSELWLSVGDLDKGLEASQKAMALNPSLSRTQTVLGFAYLTQIKIDRAKEAFENAIALDRSAPLPRLGLGLAKIRKGNLEDGRREIELAASLDPNNALIRSYLGKAYFEEKRDSYSETQLAIAKELDPFDPTPWFYDAIRKQTINRPVEALQDIQKSIELNDNRAVYRSRLLLDEDLAARSASLARIYNDLGFQQLALVEGWKSVNTDPANYSAHRFLADSYSALPRHEIARVSELLQSQLLQPINITPVQPYLAESDQVILEGAGPSSLSFNEFNPIFNRNRIALQAQGIAGGNDMLVDDLVLSGVYDKLSFSMGQFHYETDGFRENNDLDKDIYNFFAQAALTPQTSIQAEYRNNDVEKGDLDLRFDLNNYFSTLRQDESLNSIRVGFHHAFSPNSDLIGSFIYAKADDDVVLTQSIPFPPPFGPINMQLDLDGSTDGYFAEVKHILKMEKFSVSGGIGYFDGKKDEIEIAAFQPQLPPMFVNSTVIDKRDVDHINFYAYSLINYPEKVTWTVGASYDDFDNKEVDKDLFNPKFGFVWMPVSKTTVRGAAFRTLKRTFISDQTLEPTQVAGFNQFFDDFDGTEAWRYGVGLDHTFSTAVHGGAEISMRDMEVPYTTVGGGSGKTDEEERLARAYMFWTPRNWLALSAEYQFEKIESDPSAPRDDVVELDTHRIPLGINFFHPLGFAVNLKGTYVDQEGDFGNSMSGIVPGEDQFWVFDASIRYRLPKRMGIFRIDAKNIFDEEIKFQDTDPANPWLYPERLIFVKIILSI